MVDFQKGDANRGKNKRGCRRWKVRDSLQGGKSTKTRRIKLKLKLKQKTEGDVDVVDVDSVSTIADLFLARV